jgi:hypothetical protein
MAKFNPFTNTPAFTREQVSLLFGPNSNSQVANETAIKNPELYSSVKAEAVRLGLLSPGSVLEKPAPYVKTPTQPAATSLDDATLLSLPGHDEQSLRDLFQGSRDKHAIRNGNNAGNLKIGNPQKYAAARRAAQLRGIIHDSNKSSTQEPQPSSGAFRLADSMADKCQLPRGTFMSADDYGKLVISLNEVAKDEVSDNKVSE